MKILIHMKNKKALLKSNYVIIYQKKTPEYILFYSFFF